MLYVIFQWGIHTIGEQCSLNIISGIDRSNIWAGEFNRDYKITWNRVARPYKFNFDLTTAMNLGLWFWYMVKANLHIENISKSFVVEHL